MRRAVVLWFAVATTHAQGAPVKSHIALRGNTFDIQGLPALSASGKLIAVAAVDPDGDRRLPNLRVIFFPVDGRQPASTVVLTVEEMAQLGDKPAVSSLLDKIEPRLDLVNAQLAVAGF